MGAQPPGAATFAPIEMPTPLGGPMGGPGGFGPDPFGGPIGWSWWFWS